ncbi:MAG: MBL fold metallo-hydrolase [Deltaproteobacteria bacterium]|nr:MBL fold metallo-hydrolase [Candidatus Zymogenaceae bacterium]
MKRKKTLRIVLIVLAALIVACGVGWHLAMNLGATPEQTDFTVDLSEVKRLAAEGPEALPVELRGVVIAESGMPNRFAVAGGGKETADWAFTTFQIVFDDRTIIVDPVNDEPRFEEWIYDLVFHRDVYEEMQRAMDEAWLIIATHEHWDHIGGLSMSPNAVDLLTKTVLTQEQVESPVIEEVGFPDGLLDEYEPLEYEGLFRLAPGVVLIESPGHTPGSQMIYVVLSDGTEYLLIGDVVWLWDNIEKATIKPWIFSAMMGEDRDALKHETRWLNDLFVSSDTTLIPVINHDAGMIEGYFDDEIIGEGLL